MLNGSDVQLFYKLLDSLSTSLRDLAVKYELLLRESAEGERMASSVASIAKEITGTFGAMAKDIDKLKEAAADGAERDLTILASVQANIKAVEAIDAKATKMLNDMGSVSSSASDASSKAKHIDDHMDKMSVQVGELIGISQKINDMVAAVESMKKEFEPIKRLGVMLSKPVAIFLGAYFIVTTILAIIQGCEDIGKLKRHFDPAQTNATASVSRKAP